MANVLFEHEDGYYLATTFPDTDPGREGTRWREIINSDDCFLPEALHDNPLHTLVPTSDEWGKISEALREKKLCMGMFCKMVQKRIRYRLRCQVYESQVWVGEDKSEDEVNMMIQEFTAIYIHDTDSTADREARSLMLYRKVISKPRGMASDVWWEHHGWLQAVHADSMVRVKPFHPDRFGNISWDETEINVAGRGAVHEKGIIVSRRKYIFENLDRLMQELEATEGREENPRERKRPKGQGQGDLHQHRQRGVLPGQMLTSYKLDISCSRSCTSQVLCLTGRWATSIRLNN
eukprot:6471617-Amphidinium_carterae.3